MRIFGIPIGEERKYLKSIENTNDSSLKVGFALYLAERKRYEEAFSQYSKAIRLKATDKRLVEIEQILTEQGLITENRKTL